MAWNTIPASEYDVGDPILSSTMGKVKGDLDYLYGLIGTMKTNNILNPSFEIDSDADGIPDNWTLNLYPGGTSAMNVTTPAHGAKGYQFNRVLGAGNGGGYISSDYIECDEGHDYLLSLFLWSSVAGLKNLVTMSFYDKDKIILSGIGQTLYNSTANPTSQMLFTFTFKPGASARYMKVNLYGGYTDTDVAGTTYFDGLFLTPIHPFSPGSNIICSYDTLTQANQLSWTKQYELKVSRTGTLTISFDLASTAGHTVHAKIYRNGSAIGTERTTTSATPTTFTEDLSGWSTGDTVEIWTYTDNAASDANITNFRLKNAFFLDNIMEVK